MKFLRQRDISDCGATCLAMIARYYGVIANRSRLRELCDTGCDGVSLFALSSAAESIGFNTLSGKITFETLYNDVPLPCIVHWDQEHFVVVYKIYVKSTAKMQVCVADPARGKCFYSVDEFNMRWKGTANKGVVLVLELDEKSRLESVSTSSSRGGNFHFLWSHFSRYKFLFSQIFLGLLLSLVIQISLPFLTQAIVDNGINARDIKFVWIVLWGEVVLLFSRTAIDFVRAKLQLHISARVNITLISDFLAMLMRRSMKYFDKQNIGGSLQRIEDCSRVEDFLTSHSLEILHSILSFMVFGGMLAFYDGRIFLSFLLGVGLYLLWIVTFSRKRKKLDFEYFDISARSRSVTYQLINGMQEIKLQGCERRKRWEWEGVQTDLFKIRMKSLNLLQRQKTGGVAINEFMNLFITVFASASVIEGRMTMGVMLAVQYIIGQLNYPIEEFVQMYNSWQDVSISLERMGEISEDGSIEMHMDDDGLQASTEYLRPIAISSGSIEFHNVYFKYNRYSTHYILNDVSFSVPCGKVTAIVGESGCGKTTLLKLLLGYYSPNQGYLSIGECPLRSISIKWWRSQCGAVMQDSYLFSDSVANNIAVSDEEPQMERVRHAADIAMIGEDIERFPRDYATKIGVDGQGLSQGQKQRVLIARMIYKNPQIVILDEATNALDASNERAITENLRSFFSGKTVIIVAHRLSTVRRADQIVVMDRGSVAQIGTHDTLVATRGKYYELIKDQLELENG